MKIEIQEDKFLELLPKDYVYKIKKSVEMLDYFETLGILHSDCYVGKSVIDWEAGVGALAVAFLIKGAARVIAIDSWVPKEAIPLEVRSIESFSYFQTSIHDFQASHLGEKFDLIVSNTVTEHVPNLSVSFDAIYGLLESGGFYFTNHDNYFSPCGSHDHGFWFYGADNLIAFQGVKCWESLDKCQASEAHRKDLLRFPGAWMENDSGSNLSPESCGDCIYYKRSQPWAHIRYVNEFCQIFKHEVFSTPPRKNATLNKVSPFTLHQLLNEAGFEIVATHRQRSNNKPDAALLEMGVSELDLTTQMYRLLAKPRIARQ